MTNQYHYVFYFEGWMCRYVNIYELLYYIYTFTKFDYKLSILWCLMCALLFRCLLCVCIYRSMIAIVVVQTIMAYISIYFFSRTIISTYMHVRTLKLSKNASQCFVVANCYTITFNIINTRYVCKYYYVMCVCVCTYVCVCVHPCIHTSLYLSYVSL